MPDHDRIRLCVDALLALNDDPARIPSPIVAVELMAAGLIEPQDPSGYALTPEGHALLARAKLRAGLVPPEAAQGDHAVRDDQTSEQRSCVYRKPRPV
jgi:hypothetical protein